MNDSSTLFEAIAAQDYETLSQFYANSAIAALRSYQEHLVSHSSQRDSSRGETQMGVMNAYFALLL